MWFAKQGGLSNYDVRFRGHIFGCVLNYH